MPVPTPNKGESQNDFVSRCISTLKKSDPNRPDKQIQAICFSKFREKESVMDEKKLSYQARKELPSSSFVFPKQKKYPIHDLAHARNALARVAAHGTPAEIAAVRRAVYRKYPELEKKKQERENVSFSFSSPIIHEAIMLDEGKESSDRIKIGGTMVKASTSRNGRTYEFHELADAKFTGNIISVDHGDSVKDNVGFFEPKLVEDGLNFRGEVYNTSYHPGIVELVKKGLAKFVSIEAIAQKLVKEGDKVFARGLDFTGLSLVKTPGFPEATVAIAEAFKESEGEKMTEEKVIEDEENPSEEEQEEEKKEPEVKEKKDSLIEEVFKDLKEQVKELKEEVKTLKEKPVSKGIVTQETKPKSSLITERKDGKVNFYTTEGEPY